MNLFQRAAYVTVTSATIILMATACGKSNLAGNQKAKGQQLGGDAGTCLKLGDVGSVSQTPVLPPKQMPIDPSGGKNGGPVIAAPVNPAPTDPHGGKGTDVIVVPPTLNPAPVTAPVLPAPTEPTPTGCAPVVTPQNPGQTPSQVPVTNPPVNNPPANYPPVVTTPIGGGPAQVPTDPNQCGKDSLFCGGGPGQSPQWPPHSVGGGSYSQGDVSSCMHAFQAAGINISGQWNIDVRSSLNISVLSGGLYDDHSTDHALIIVKSVAVLGKMHFNLLNPNALYCLKDVSVLDQVSVTSCYQSNVASLLNVSVLSSNNVQVVDCGAH